MIDIERHGLCAASFWEPERAVPFLQSIQENTELGRNKFSGWVQGMNRDFGRSPVGQELHKFTEHPKLADAASKLLESVFGREKTSTRLITGVVSLPLGLPVALEIIFEIAL